MTSEPGPKRPAEEEASGEEKILLESLRRHGKVIEADSEDVPLPAGVTHVLVKKPGCKSRLVEKRKSFL
jgi:hypothetical protein